MLNRQTICQLTTNRQLLSLSAVVLSVFLSAGLMGSVHAKEPAATPWTKVETYARTRLIAGRVAQTATAPELYAAIELRLAKGWKTYWRNPGDAAGVPPQFNFMGSRNLSSPKVLYPAPHRFKTPDGDSLGYKTAVAFPMRLQPLDPSKPIALKLTFEYGICSEICIPAQAEFAVTIPTADQMPIVQGTLADALAAVPRLAISSAGKPVSTQTTQRPHDPVFLSAKAHDLTGNKPNATFVVTFPGGHAGADLFVEGPDEAFIPQPQRIAVPPKTAPSETNKLTFVIDFAKGADLSELKGKTLRLTAVSDAGQTEMTWVLR